MKTVLSTAGNSLKAGRAEAVWRDLLGQVLQRGFFGSVTVEVSVQDGTIQHLKHRIEQMEK
jgi:hypothetical protein